MIRLRSRRAAASALAAAILLTLAGAPVARGVGPGPSPTLAAIQVDRLENGLTVVSLALPDPDFIVFATIIRAGARNETEPGTEGFARLIEHLAAKEPRQSPRGLDPDLAIRIGAKVTGFAGADATIRTIVFGGRENLEDVVRGEADRIINLEFDPETVRREAAVLAAESETPAADPDGRLVEVLRRTAFASHPYGRPELGTRDEILSLPDRIAAGQLFKKRLYTPDNVILLAAGDVVRERLLALVRRHYGGWEKSNFEIVVPPEPGADEPRRVRVAWPIPTRARLAIGFRAPAFSDREPDHAALDLLAAAAFSPSSPLFERLVRRDRKALTLDAFVDDRRDPGLLIVRASAATEADLPVIEKAILDEAEHLRADFITVPALLAARAGRRHARLLAMETTEETAAVLAGIIGLTGDPESLGRLSGLYESVGVAEIREAARRFLQPAATAILAPGEPPAPAVPDAGAAKEDRP